MIDSEYITADEWDVLNKEWEAGHSGQSWFKDSVDGTEFQAYIVGADKLVSFCPAWKDRIPFHLTRNEYERLFND